MKDNNFDPILVEKAKRMAAGPLGKEMAKFPLRFAAPASFGQMNMGTEYGDVHKFISS